MAILVDLHSANQGANAVMHSRGIVSAYPGLWSWSNRTRLCKCTITHSYYSTHYSMLHASLAPKNVKKKKGKKRKKLVVVGFEPAHFAKS